jgi:hypothetical protein
MISKSLLNKGFFFNQIALRAFSGTEKKIDFGFQEVNYEEK